jgi:hypothetical protein
VVIQNSATNLKNLENPKFMKRNRQPKFSDGPPKILGTGLLSKQAQNLCIAAHFKLRHVVFIQKPKGAKV